MKISLRRLRSSAFVIVWTSRVCVDFAERGGACRTYEGQEVERLADGAVHANLRGIFAVHMLSGSTWYELDTVLSRVRPARLSMEAFQRSHPAHPTSFTSPSLQASSAFLNNGYCLTIDIHRYLEPILQGCSADYAQPAHPILRANAIDAWQELTRDCMSRQYGIPGQRGEQDSLDHTIAKSQSYRLAHSLRLFSLLLINH